MYNDTVEAVAKAAASKLNFLKKNPIGFFISSVLAGMFIGFGILLIMSIGGLLTGQPEKKIVMGACFGIALSLVVICGSELFTGNNMVMGLGIMENKVSLSQAVQVWVVCLLGNWIGSILIAVIFHLAGLNSGATMAVFSQVSLAKMQGSFISLFMKGILCNILVCLAVWSSFRCKNEMAKLIMIWWCLFTFITAGFEHSVANMTVLTVGLLAPNGLALSLNGYFFNIFTVIAGNMVGGILFVAFPYHMIAHNKED